MSLKPLLLNDKAISDLKGLLSVNSSLLDSIIDTVSVTLDKQPIPSERLVLNIDESKLATDEKTVMLATKTIVNLSNYVRNQNEKQRFLAAISTKMEPGEIERIRTIISKLESKHLPEKFGNILADAKLEKFGLPSFRKLSLMADYRLKTDEEKKQIVPVIIMDLRIRDYSKTTNSESERISFQMTPSDLDQLIGQLQEYNSKLKREIAFMKERVNI